MSYIFIISYLYILNKYDILLLYKYGKEFGYDFARMFGYSQRYERESWKR
nr:MAG TPA: hypothetical protein [Caudoviricetes sp.]